MTSIFVAKLDFGVTEEELRALFEAYGDVKKAHIATDRETGKPRGFAFVEMYNDDDAQKAIQELDGRSINGRNIAVKEADDRRGGGGSGGNKPSHGGGNRPTHSGSNRPQREFKPKQDQSLGSEKPPVNDFIPPVKQDDDDFSSDDAQKAEKRRKNNPTKTKEVDNTVDGGAKKKKLNPYKKSGKDQIHFDDDEDMDFDLFGRDEDVEVDEDDLSKYLVNSDDEYDDEYDEYDEDDQEDEDNW